MPLLSVPELCICYLLHASDMHKSTRMVVAVVYSGNIAGWTQHDFLLLFIYLIYLFNLSSFIVSEANYRLTLGSAWLGNTPNRFRRGEGPKKKNA